VRAGKEGGREGVGGSRYTLPRPGREGGKKEGKGGTINGRE